MPENHCNADTQANTLFTSLTADAPTPPVVDLSDALFSFIPDTDSTLYGPAGQISIDDLTTGSLEGTGVFDKLMHSVDLHIQREFKSNRITGDQYATVYTEIMGGVLSNSTQFLLSQEKARWDAITAQLQGRIVEIQSTTALVELEKTKIEAAKLAFDMQNSGAQYGLTKMQIANADAQYCGTLVSTKRDQYGLDFTLPAELSIQNYQRMKVLPSTVAINEMQSDRVLPAEAAIKEFINRELQPIEKDTQAYQLATDLPLETALKNFTLDSMMPVSLAQEQHKLNFQMPAQTNLLNEQKEKERAQTMETRSDGLTSVVGVIGKQKESLTLDIATKQYNLDNTMPIQLDLVREQREAESAKTLDTRSDG